MMLLIFIIGLATLSTSLPEPYAYQFYSDNTNDQGGCAQCHTGFRDNNDYVSAAENFSWGTSLHNVHLNETDVDSNCGHCHYGAETSGRTVNLSSSAEAADGVNAISCMGCHGRLEDSNNVTEEGTGWGAGLRQHHFNAGVTTCKGCHADADPTKFTTAGEDTMPPWYGFVRNTNVNLLLSSCNVKGVENLSGDPAGLGLDNDGDHVYDGLDSDCKGIISGDINDDGTINLTDTILALKVISNITPPGSIFKEADVNGDGFVGLEEAIHALQFTSELRIPPDNAFMSIRRTGIGEIISPQP